MSLEVNVGEEPAKVTEGLTKQLTAQGFVVQPNEPIKVVATTTTGESKEITYQHFFSREQTKVSVTPQIAKLAITVGGQTLWETQLVNSAAPFHLSLKQGESVQQALAPYQKPPIHLFLSARLPSYIPNLGGKKTMGVSALSPQGAVPVAAK